MALDFPANRGQPVGLWARISLSSNQTESASLLAPVPVITRHVHLVQIRGDAVGSGNEFNLPIEETRKVGFRLRDRLHFLPPLQLGVELAIGDRDFDDSRVRTLAPNVLFFVGADVLR